MKKVIVKTGGETRNLWEIKEYLHRMYPGVRDNLSWYVSFDGKGGYGIAETGEKLQYFSRIGIKEMKERGYIILEREEIKYELNLKKILEEE